MKVYAGNVDFIVKPIFKSLMFSLGGIIELKMNASREGIEHCTNLIDSLSAKKM